MALPHFLATIAPIRRAGLYVSARGVVELELNGMRVAKETLTPGWSRYPDRLRYYTYDVTSQLRLGDNVVGGWLADGW